MSKTPAIRRFVLDVNVLLSTLLHTGPIRDVDVITSMNVAGVKESNSLRVVRSIMQQVGSQTPVFQAHVTPHVLATLEYKLVNPTRTHGVPAYAPWTQEQARTSVAAIVAAFESMYAFGWTFDSEPVFTRSALNGVVPASMRTDRKFEIDDEDRKVLLGALEVAGLPEHAPVPVITVLVTNDGGLQLTNEYVSKRYSTPTTTFAVMTPAQVAGGMEMLVKASRTAVRV